LKTGHTRQLASQLAFGSAQRRGGLLGLLDQLVRATEDTSSASFISRSCWSIVASGAAVLVI